MASLSCSHMSCMLCVRCALVVAMEAMAARVQFIRCGRCIETEMKAERARRGYRLASGGGISWRETTGNTRTTHQCFVAAETMPKVNTRTIFQSNHSANTRRGKGAAAAPPLARCDCVHALLFRTQPVDGRALFSQ